MSSSIVTLVKFDVSTYQFLSYDIHDSVMDEDLLLFFDGTEKATRWRPVPVYVPYPRLTEPDLWSLNATASIAMTLEIADRLAAPLHLAGELLPIYRECDFERIEMVVLNIIRDIDCLDMSRSDLDTHELYSDFIEHRLPPSGLFKIPQLDTSRIFHVERVGDSDSFRHRVERLGLTGLRFKEVWSTEAGSILGNLLEFGAL